MMIPPYGGSAGKVPMLLLSLAAGYGVLVLSLNQKRPLDMLGRFIGGLILAVSLIGLLCVAVCGLRCRMGACPYEGNRPHACVYPVPGHGDAQPSEASPADQK